MEFASSSASPSGTAIPGKLFVGGLKSETNKEALHAHFKRYGMVTEARVMYDWSNGKSRRFGFVTFEDTAAACRALDPREKDNHIIDGHKVDVKQAVLKETRTEGPSRNSSSNANDVPNGKKIFVGGLPTDITDDEFRAFFKKFGRITDAVVLKDKNINRPRGFGFVTFETEESAHKVLENQFHEIRPNKKVEVKKAIPKIEGNIRHDDNNNDGNGVGSSINNNNINNGGKYNPGIRKFPSDEYTHAVNYPVQFCDYMYPYTWYTPMVYAPIGYGPMGFGPMGYGPIEYGGWNCTNPNINCGGWNYTNPNITYDSHMHPGNIQHGGFCNNIISGRISLNFSGGGNSGAVDSANEGVSRNTNATEAAEGANKACGDNEERAKARQSKDK